MCVATDALKAVNGSVDVVVFNPLAHRREREVVAVPVPVDRGLSWCEFCDGVILFMSLCKHA